MRRRLALEPGFALGLAWETAEQRSAERMPEPFGLESPPQRQGPSSYQPCWSAMLALSKLVLFEPAAEQALWEWTHNNKETAAVPRTL